MFPPRALRRAWISLMERGKKEEDVVIYDVVEGGMVPPWLTGLFRSPRVEMFGVLLGIVTTWYLRRRGCLTQPGDGGHVALSKRVARGLPLLLATGLWHLLLEYGGPPSRLDPLIAILSWLLLEMALAHVPAAAWNALDLGPPPPVDRAVAVATDDGSVPDQTLAFRGLGWRSASLNSLDSEKWDELSEPARTQRRDGLLQQKIWGRADSERVPVRPPASSRVGRRRWSWSASELEVEETLRVEETPQALMRRLSFSSLQPRSPDNRGPEMPWPVEGAVDNPERDFPTEEKGTNGKGEFDTNVMRDSAGAYSDAASIYPLFDHDRAAAARSLPYGTPTSHEGAVWGGFSSDRTNREGSDVEGRSVREGSGVSMRQIREGSGIGVRAAREGSGAAVRYVREGSGAGRRSVRDGSDVSVGSAREEWMTAGRLARAGSGASVRSNREGSWIAGRSEREASSASTMAEENERRRKARVAETRRRLAKEGAAVGVARSKNRSASDVEPDDPDETDGKADRPQGSDATALAFQEERRSSEARRGEWISSSPAGAAVGAFPSSETKISSPAKCRVETTARGGRDESPAGCPASTAEHAGHQLLDDQISQSPTAADPSPSYRLALRRRRLPSGAVTPSSDAHPLSQSTSSAIEGFPQGKKSGTMVGAETGDVAGSTVSTGEARKEGPGEGSIGAPIAVYHSPMRRVGREGESLRKPSISRSSRRQRRAAAATQSRLRFQSLRSAKDFSSWEAALAAPTTGRGAANRLKKSRMSSLSKRSCPSPAFRKEVVRGTPERSSSAKADAGSPGSEEEIRLRGWIQEAAMGRESSAHEGADIAGGFHNEPSGLMDAMEGGEVSSPVMYVGTSREGVETATEGKLGKGVEDEGERECEREREEDHAGDVSSGDETDGDWVVGDALFKPPDPDGLEEGRVAEQGTPVPADFRPTGREEDVLCKWRLGDLRKDKAVGMFAQGSFGKVTAAKLESGKHLAVKVVEKSELSPVSKHPPAMGVLGRTVVRCVATKSAVSRERYIERELELLRECSVHPHVVGLLGVIRTRETVYVLMPLADTDLAAMIKTTKRLDEKQASFCVRQVVLAVEFLHSRNIIHRDVKPANLLVLSNKVLLADFGLAKRIPPGHDAITGACGTKPYLAPELVRDLPYDKSVDLWAIGVVTFELLHGYTPFCPPLKRARSWDGLLQVPRGHWYHHRHRKRPYGEPGGAADPDASDDDDGDDDSMSGTASVSESSGSVVQGRIFERSAPPGPGQGLDRAWLAARAHNALIFGGRNGDDNDLGEPGWASGVGAHAWRKGYREQEQIQLLNSIVRGRYRMKGKVVGPAGRRFIAQLLQQSPGMRMSATHAAEHPWLGNPSKVPPRRRAARAEVAAVTARRAAESARRYAAVALDHLDDESRKPGRTSWLDGLDAGRRESVAVAAAAVSAALVPLSEIENLAAVMSSEVESAREEARRWEKAAVKAEKEMVPADKGDPGTAGTGRARASSSAEEGAAKKAELAVRRAEAMAREVEAGEAAAAAAFKRWELAVADMTVVEAEAQEMQAARSRAGSHSSGESRVRGRQRVDGERPARLKRMDNFALRE